MDKKHLNAPIELEAYRTAFSKEFMNLDGTISMELSERPIHYKDKSGSWIEIQNNLVPADIPDYIYTNKSNSYKVMFAKNNKDGKLVRLVIDDEHWIDMNPTDIFTDEGITDNNTIIYKDIVEGVDLEYVIISDRVKEYLILNKQPNNNTFKFSLKNKRIFYEDKKQGEVWAINEDTGDKVFSFSKPLAEDNRGNINDELIAGIRKSNSGDEYFITIDNSWLKTASYPVVIDPTIQISTRPTSNESRDTFISSINPNSTYDQNIYLHAGTHSTYGITRSFLRFPLLPSIRPFAKITEAYLGIYMYLGVETDTTVIDSHQITSDWKPDTTTWNNQPSFRATPESSVTSNKDGEWMFDITNLVRKWYSVNQDLYGAVPNYGIMLKAADESTPRRSFLSGDNPNIQPRLIINYEIDAIGNEDFWEYHENVNVFNGNLALTDTDITLPGRGVPIQVSRTYNSRAYSPSSYPFGYGWTYNFAIYLNYMDDGVVAFTNQDGNKYIFVRNSEGVYQSPAGVSLILTIESGKYVITDSSGIQYNFNNSGKLDSIMDTYGNTTRASYRSDGNISRITDSSGRYIAFNYTNGKLTSIIGAEIPTVEYYYNGTSDLRLVLKKDKNGDILEQVTYGYDNYHNVTSITDGEGHTTEISYIADDRVYQIRKQLTTNETVNNLVTTYNYQINSDNVVTQVTDPKGNITQYTCNKFGNVEEMIEDWGSGKLNLITRYTWDENMALTGIRDPKQVYEGQNGYGFYYNDLEDSEYPQSKYDVNRVVLPDNTYSSYERFKNDENKGLKYRSDITQTIDPAGGVERFTYTDERNVSSIYNPFVYAQSADYNEYGDLVKETKQLGVQENLLPNTSFERWTGNIPSQWIKVGSGGAISRETFYKVNGFNSVKLVSTGSTNSTIAQLRTNDFIPVQGNSKYNISWHVKTQKVGATNGGATVNVYWYDEKRSPISNLLNIARATGTSDWMRRGARVDAPGNARFVQIELILNAVGTAWFDNVQMETGSTINQYNFISNSSFELDQDGNPGPDFWYMGTLQPGDGVVTNQSHTGNKSLLVNGAAGNKYFNYDVMLAGAAGEPIYFSGWSKAQGISQTGGYYGLLLYIRNTDGTEVWFPAPFTKSTHDWEFVEQIYVPEKDYEFFGIYGKVEDQTGQIWFDDITVRFASAGNALISTYNILQNDSFEYPNSTGDWSDYWPKFVDDSVPGNYDISWIDSTETIEAFRENKMIRISNVPSWAVVANAIFEPIERGKTYTAYGAIKTENVSGSGAVINIDILDKNGVYLSQKSSKPLTGTTHDWTIVSVSLSESEAKKINPDAAWIRVSAGTTGATSGTMYFDMIRLIDERAETTYEYTGNYLTSTTDVLGNQVKMVNDIRGNVISRTDAKGYTNNYDYNIIDQQKAVENAMGLLTEYTYDKNGNVKEIINKNKVAGDILNKFSMDYNELGLVKRRIDPLNQVTAYEYDLNGNMTKIDAPNGKDVLFTNYDNVNRLKSIRYIGDSTTWDFDYDRNDNLILTTKNGNISTRYSYDSLDRINKIIYPTIGGRGHETEYSYNPIGQLLNMRHTAVSAVQPSVQYTYDRGHMNVSVYDPNNGEVAFMHDTEGRIKKSYLRSDTAYINYRDYDSKGRVIRAYTENNQGIAIVNITYEYDKNDNIVKENDLINNSYIIYEYDSLNQLTAEKYYNSQGTLTKEKEYKYESQYGGLLGNRTETTVIEGSSSTTTIYRYNAANELISTSVGRYTYDANGNMTGGDRTYVYNAENQLIQIVSNGNTIAQYEYNDQGLRSKKIAGGITEHYYYDNRNLSYITDEQNNLKYFFTRDSKGNLLNMIDWTASPHKTYWYIFDARQNVVGLADGSGQAVVTYQYSAFGEITNSTGTITTGDGRFLRDANPFRYASYQYDKESDFYYLKSRYYIPFMGRFLTRDDVPSNNLYEYCDNNPVNYVDHSGFSKTRDSKGDTGLRDLSDEEISRRARDKSLSPKERKRYQTEEKYRGNRNKQKRKNRHKDAIIDNISAATGLTGTALIMYLIISEGTRLFPPRNLIPVL